MRDILELLSQKNSIKKIYFVSKSYNIRLQCISIFKMFKLLVNDGLYNVEFFGYKGRQQRKLLAFKSFENLASRF